MKVAVIGAGAAGVAAAWTAARAGADVSVVHGRAGATALYSGALDRVPWESGDVPSESEPELDALAKALGVWTLGARERRVATPAGVLRPAGGIDVALLDLAELGGRRVAVADVERDDWSAPALARSLSDTAWARAARVEFYCVPVPLSRGGERRIGVYDFARMHDEPSRADALVEALRRIGAADGWLVGPWLGIEPETVKRIRAALGRPIGETTSPPGGPAGARFERARDRLLESLGVELVHGAVERVEPNGRGWTLLVAGGEPIEADAVVIAVGGVAAGGVELERPRLGHRGGAGFRLSLGAPVPFELDGNELDAASTLHGVDFEALGLGALERVGVASDGPRVVGQTTLFVAGDVVAARPRTVLEAARAGIAAARAALG
jgi:glycine/D-amino acid oxidase-like deaminating enzyme